MRLPRKAESLRELFDDKPNRWTKGIKARARELYEVNPRAKEAISWCLIGGVEACYPLSKREEIFCRLRNAITEFLMQQRHRQPISDSIVSFKDSHTRKFRDIKIVIEMAKI